MQPLTAELLAAQHAQSAVPALRVRLYDYDAGVPRLRWQRWQADDPAPPAGPIAAAVAGDGALLRARVDVATGQLTVQRVATPTEDSDYTVWSALGTVDVGAGVALAATGDHALLVTAAAGGTSIEVRASTDGGVQWGAPTVAFTVASAAAAVAGAVQADGSAFCTAATAGTVMFVTRTGLGGWSGAQAWAHSLGSISGLAALFVHDYALAITGTDSAGETGVWTTVYGIGNAAPPATWLGLQPLVTASVGTAVSYGAPALMVADVARVAFVETHQGAVTAHRAHLATAVIGTAVSDARWREPRPLDIADVYGVALAAAAGEAWYLTGGVVSHARADNLPFDLDGTVIEADLRRSLDGGGLRLVLDGGALPSGPAAPAALAPGGELWIDVGYTTSVGVQYGSTTRCWIRLVRRHRRGGRALVEVEAVDGWGLLAAWQAARLRVWDGSANGLTLLSGLIELTGLRLSAGAISPELQALTPRFVLRPGESGAQALGRVLRMIPELVVMRGIDATLRSADPDAATDYAYGSDHVVLALETEDADPGVGWARVFAEGRFAESVGADVLDSGGGLRVTIDDDLATQDRADARAETVLRRAARSRRRGRLVVPANVGQEPGDIVAVTDPLLPDPATRFRVDASRLRFDRDRGRYDSTLDLVEV